MLELLVLDVVHFDDLLLQGNPIHPS